jgi:hypothetical protein
MKPMLPEDREIDQEGAEVSRRYREAAREEPSARVDAAILAAARREAGRPAVVRNWRTPAAVAAVLVIGVSVALLTRESVDPLPPLDQSRGQADVAKPAAPSLAMKSEPTPEARLDLRSRPSRDRSERTDREAQSRPGEEARSADEGQSPAAPPAQQFDGPVAAAQAPSLQGAPPDKPAAAKSGAESSAGDGAMAENAATQGSVQEKKALADAQEDTRVQAKRLRKEESVAAVAPAGRQSPEQWLRSIEDLLRNGRPADARLQLAEFRKRYPDYRLPDALQAFEREAAPAAK